MTADRGPSTRAVVGAVANDGFGIFLQAARGGAHTDASKRSTKSRVPR